MSQVDEGWGGRGLGGVVTVPHPSFSWRNMLAVCVISSENDETSLHGLIQSIDGRRSTGEMGRRWKFCGRLC